MMTPRGLDGALALLDIAAEDVATAELAMNRFIVSALPPELQVGRWDPGPLVEALRAPLLCLVYRLAEAYDLPQAELLATLRADVRNYALPSDVGELQRLWEDPKDNDDST